MLRTIIVHLDATTTAFEKATRDDLNRWCATKLVCHNEAGQYHVIPFTAIGRIAQEEA